MDERELKEEVEKEIKEETEKTETAKKKKKNAEAEKWEQEAEENKRKWYAVTAEYENYRRRTQGESAKRYTEGRNDVIAAFFKFSTHLFDALLRGFQSCHGRVLRNTARVGGLLTLEARHFLRDGRRSERPADAPSGHCIGLRDTVDDDRAVHEFRTDGRETDESVPAVDEIFVNFIRDDPKVFFNGFFHENHLGILWQ